MKIAEAAFYARKKYGSGIYIHPENHRDVLREMVSYQGAQWRPILSNLTIDSIDIFITDSVTIDQYEVLTPGEFADKYPNGKTLR